MESLIRTIDVRANPGDERPFKDELLGLIMKHGSSEQGQSIRVYNSTKPVRSSGN
jgi:hypothetical protein